MFSHLTSPFLAPVCINKFLRYFCYAISVRVRCNKELYIIYLFWLSSTFRNTKNITFSNLQITSSQNTIFFQLATANLSCYWPSIISLRSLNSASFQINASSYLKFHNKFTKGGEEVFRRIYGTSRVGECAFSEEGEEYLYSYKNVWYRAIDNKEKRMDSWCRQKGWEEVGIRYMH